MIKFIRGLSSNLEWKPGKPPKKRTKYQNLNVKGKMAYKDNILAFSNNNDNVHMCTMYLKIVNGKCPAIKE